MKPSPRGAWVYLAQNTKRDESYGLDRRTTLARILSGLYEYSVNEFHCQQTW